MILQNLMEEKQLDFNQPLLSVRRNSSAHPPSETEDRRKPRNMLPKLPPLPVYKSELKSGPVRNPGTVPFQWERSPGRPKDESKSQSQGPEKPPIAPRLPPGRTSNIKQPALSSNFESRPVPHSQNVSSLDKKVTKTKYESPKHIAADARSFDSEDDDDVDAYVDAADTLSRSESFFMNCSISGVSDLDGPDLQPSGIFLSDPQTRDLMMGRFLPAAKAMASETPPHATRKQLVAQEQTRQGMKVVPKEKRCPRQHNPKNLPYSPHIQNERWDESEDEDEDENDRTEYTSAGACGLLPQFCLRSSFGLLNPVPGVRMQAQKAVSVRQLRAKYPPPGYAENENEYPRAAGYEQKPTGAYQMTEMHEDKIKPKSNPHQSAYGSLVLNGSFLQGTLQGNEISLSHDELSTSHIEGGKEKVNLQSSTPSHNKSGKNFGELLAREDDRCESGSVSPVVEKTLYIDTVHEVKSSSTKSSSSDTMEITGYGGVDLVAHGKIAEGHPSVDCRVKDVEHLNVADDKAVSDPKGLEPVVSCVPSLTQDRIKSRNQGKAEKKRVHFEIEITKEVRTRESPLEHNAAIIPVPRWEVTGSTNRKIDLEIGLRKRSSTPESSNGDHPQHPVPPPLPKAPSDSWLKRTLPTISAKSSSTRSPLSMQNYSKILALKASVADPKWETIVKTTNTRHSHLRYSAEKLNPIPEA